MSLVPKAAKLRGRLLRQEPMSRHTSWRVGGPAEWFYQPADLDDLVTYLGQLPAAQPLFFIGLGSNLLVRDGGLRGTVIATSGGLGRIERQGDLVFVEAGVPSAKVARFCAKAGLAGAEFLAGIPGTFGGALAMNAGCHGAETWSLVEQVETVDRTGERRIRRREEYRVSYRSVAGPAQEWFAAAWLRLSEGVPEELMERIRGLLNRRSQSQPTQEANAGSVFKNPPGTYAARLIEAAGLKGRCIGGARVSDKHANFIVNSGEASAADVEALIGLVMHEVEAIHGVRLQPEVKIVGEVGNG